MNNNGRTKRDGSVVDNYIDVIELTHVSYSTIDETRNIFVYIDKENTDEESNYKMITNENLDIGEGYTCSKGKCYVIERDGYYLNTAQLGNNEKNGEPGYHELVKCSNGKCEFEDSEKASTYENAVATGVDDAIISCSKVSGCQAVAVTGGIGLAKCKENAEKSGPYVDVANEKKIYYENGVELIKDKYCIYNGAIYGVYNSGENKKEEGIYMFDVTSRFINYENVKESHVYASLYYCSNLNKCFQTYGFIINDDNGYSVCSSEGCKYISNLEGISSRCEVAGNGNVIKDGSVLKFCNNDLPVTVSDSYYPININVEGSFPETKIGDKLIIGVKNNVAFKVIEDGYLVIDSKLYECNTENKNCVPIENELNNYGYYKNAFSLKPISCGENGCRVCAEGECNNIEFSTEDKIKTYSYKESFVGIPYGVIVVTMKNKQNILLANTYILLNEENGKSSELYLCNGKTGKCELQKEGEKSGPYSGWYISGDGKNKAYKCESGTYSAIVTLNSSCTNFGKLIYNSRDNIYQICDTKAKPTDVDKNDGLIKTIVPDSNSKNLFSEEKNVILINKYSVLGIGKEEKKKERGR